MMYSMRHLPDIEHWLQRHPEADSSWPGWPKASLGGGGTWVSVAPRTSLDHFHSAFPESPDRSCTVLSCVGV